MGPANGLGLRGLRAHQPNFVYDQDPREMAITCFRARLRRCRAWRLMGCRGPANPAQGSVALIVMRFGRRCFGKITAVFRPKEVPVSDRWQGGEKGELPACSGTTAADSPYDGNAQPSHQNLMGGGARTSTRRWGRDALSPSYVEASGFISSFTRSATRDLVMLKATRGLANRGIPWTLDRKPCVANLLVMHSTAPFLTGHFVASTTRG